MAALLGGLGDFVDEGMIAKLLDNAVPGTLVASAFIYSGLDDVYFMAEDNPILSSLKLGLYCSATQVAGQTLLSTFPMLQGLKPSRLLGLSGMPSGSNLPVPSLSSPNGPVPPISIVQQ
jgi:hypothetical protein